MSGFLAEMTGYSPRQFRGKTAVPKTQLGRRRLISRARDKSIEILSHYKGFPEHMVREWQSEFDPSTADRRVLEYWLKSLNSPDPLFELPQTIRLAREIDALSASINDADIAGDVDRLKALLTNDPGILRFNRPSILDEKHVNPDQYLANVQLRDTDEAWIEYAFILAQNASMALLAQLDKEYTPQYFASFEPRHSLLLVTPQVKLKSDQTAPSGKIISDLLIPQRRLLDVFACLAHYFEEGEFSKGIPPMSQFALQAFDPDDDDASPSKKLSRWRRGEVPLTHKAIENIWDAINQNMELAGLRSIAAPWPLAVAAVYWQYLYVKLKYNRNQSLWLIDENYKYWLSQSQNPAHGDHVTEPWPDCFSWI